MIEEARTPNDGVARGPLTTTTDEEIVMATKTIAHQEYILRGLNANGGEFFYTGKAGSGWVSKDKKEAFGYWTEQMARGKAMSFNQFCPLHGLWFVAMATDADIVVEEPELLCQCSEEPMKPELKIVK
jgi:hypothetical protein